MAETGSVSKIETRVGKKQKKLGGFKFSPRFGNTFDDINTFQKRGFQKHELRTYSEHTPSHTRTHIHTYTHEHIHKNRRQTTILYVDNTMFVRSIFCMGN